LNISAQIPGGVYIIAKKKLIKVVPTRHKQRLPDPCDPPEPAAHQEDRFSEETLRKQSTLQQLKTCRRVRITDPPYNNWGYGKIIIAVPGQILLWFPEKFCHLCFLKEKNI
jgi:hypothetical protein